MLKEQNNELVTTVEFLCNPCWLMKNVFKQRVSIAHSNVIQLSLRMIASYPRAPGLDSQHPIKINQPSVLPPEGMFMFVWLTATPDLLLSYL